MNYQLAKELYENGFLHDNWVGLEKDGGAVSKKPWEWYQPSLSELIDGCPHTLQGRGVFTLSSINNGEFWGAHYMSYLPPIKVDDEYAGVGKTPEEAVARLWLALNKKD